MSFVIRIEPEAKQDIQEAIDWYNYQQSGLGGKFYLSFLDNIQRLKTNPYYQIRYADVRCLPITKFPFMIHFTIEASSNTVIIRAVFNTSLDPEKWKGRNL